MECHYHPEREATDICAICGKSICKECGLEIAGKFYCKDCLEKIVGLGLDNNPKQNTAQPEPTVEEKPVEEKPVEESIYQPQEEYEMPYAVEESVQEHKAINDDSPYNIKDNIEGIETNITEEGNIKITEVKVINENGANSIGKPVGSYITIDINKLKLATDEEIECYGNALSKELKKLIDQHVEKQDEILVVGLGNIYVTPDSLGPKVINEVDVTRHILKYMPEALEEGTRAVSAISPGVLGTTGMETLEIVNGIVNNVKPKLIIVIDALASRSIERISSSIQLADTGIVPGAGVGNTRKELSQNTLNIPVIAIGIPTVVDLRYHYR